MSREDIEAVRRMFDAFNRGDVEAVLEAFDPGCELASCGRGQGSGVPIPEWTTFAAMRPRDGKIARADGFLSRDETVRATLARRESGC